MTTKLAFPFDCQLARDPFPLVIWRDKEDTGERSARKPLHGFPNGLALGIMKRVQARQKASFLSGLHLSISFALHGKKQPN